MIKCPLCKTAVKRPEPNLKVLICLNQECALYGGEITERGWVGIEQALAAARAEGAALVVDAEKRVLEEAAKFVEDRRSLWLHVAEKMDVPMSPATSAVEQELQSLAAEIRALRPPEAGAR